MSLLRIAARIASKRFGFSQLILEKITDEMHQAMKIDESAEPSPFGVNSVVYVNENGNIVSFSDWDKLFEVGQKAEGKGSNTLPEIYRVEKFQLPDDDEEKGFFDTGPSFLFAVEMQKLIMLDSAEKRTWNKYSDIFRGEELGEVSPEDNEFVQRMLALKKKSEKDGVTQKDPEASNVGMDDQGNFKWIDLELVEII